MMTEHERLFVFQISRLSKDLNHPLDQIEIEQFLESIPNPHFKTLLMAYSELFGELSVNDGYDLKRRLKLKYKRIQDEVKDFNLKHINYMKQRENNFERL